MKLVAGLGNPGRKYQETRHNIGFRVLAELARRYSTAGVRRQFHGETVDASIARLKHQSEEGQLAAGQPVRTLLLCPQTYMNKSGSSVLAARDFYKIPLSDLLLVCDDFNLPFGRLRVRAKGSAGGQRGLEDVIRRLGSSDFARLRIGIGPPPPGWDVADFVLSKFDGNEQAEVEQVVAKAADAVALWATEGTSRCMNEFNAKVG